MKLKVILSAAFLLFLSPEIYSMSGCIRGPVSWEFKRAAAVFTGQVIAIEYQPHEGTQVESQRVRIKAQKWWKGDGSDEVLVSTGWARKPDGINWETFGVMYAYNFTIGESYLIYAFNSRFEDELRTDRCRRTNTLFNADFDLNELGEGFLPGMTVHSNSLDLPNNDSCFISN